MDNTMTYKGFTGTVEFSEPDGVFFGKVTGIHSLVSYEGKNEKDLIEDFHNAVDQYLELCQIEGKEPEKTQKEI